MGINYHQFPRINGGEYFTCLAVLATSDDLSLVTSNFFMGRIFIFQSKEEGQLIFEKLVQQFLIVNRAKWIAS